MSIDDTVTGHVAKLAEGRNMLARALDDDLRKLSETRGELDASIDATVTGHIAKLADSRNILTRALEDDLRKLSETRGEFDASIGATVTGHVATLADSRDILARRDAQAIIGARSRSCGIAYSRDILARA